MDPSKQEQKRPAAQEEQQPMPSAEAEEASLRKKYGGLQPKKPPLISKDHERAFFDSADWALGKQGAPVGQKPKSLIESLRPKLQPTHHQPLPSRKAAYIAPDGEADDEASEPEAGPNGEANASPNGEAAAAPDDEAAVEPSPARA